jgi:hypothetical protein
VHMTSDKSPVSFPVSTDQVHVAWFTLHSNHGCRPRIKHGGLDCGSLGAIKSTVEYGFNVNTG